MSIGCAVQFFCWVCVFFAVSLFVGFSLSVWEAITSSGNFCTRSQLLIGAECAQKTRKLEDVLMKVNKTVRFLRPPSDYKSVVDHCIKAEICLNKITCEDGHDFVQDVRDTFPACEFFKFYAGPFEKCANSLIPMAANYTCLDTLFNAKYLIKQNRCEEWRNMQPCVHDAIAIECDGNSTQLAFQFAELSSDFYRSMNCDPKWARIGSGEFDYEIVGLMNDE